MAARRHLSLCLTPDRESDILGFIRHFEMEEDEVTILYSGPHTDHQEGPVAGGQEVPEEPAADHQPPEEPVADPQPPESPPPAEPAAALIPQAEEQEECRYCLCRPCITTPVPLWLVGQAACVDNAAIRRDMYKNFWGMMANLMPSPWNDPRYLARKHTRMAQDSALEAPRRRLVIAGSIREIMPKCVVKLVRSKYPNPPGVDYMGHRWV
ncbi:Neurexophilin [Branchiostoma belcheri]|nr:Neurexophilin [Branchiostoma belcheri]